MDWVARSIELLWIGGLAAVPVAAIAWICCCCRCRPATRHALWFAVLGSFVAPMLTASIWRPSWFRSDRVLAAADSLKAPLDLPAGRDNASDPRPVLSASPEQPARARSRIQAPAPPARTASQPPTIYPAPQRTKPESNTGSRSPDQRRAERTSGTVNLPFVSNLSKPKPETAGPATPAPLAPIEAPANGDHPALRARAPEPGPPAAPRALAPLSPDARSLRGSLRQWAEHVLLIRDALASAPPLPAEILLAGSAFVAALGTVRFLAIRRIVKHGIPAPERVNKLVVHAAAIAGLRRAPETLMVGDRVSPMVWCGLRPRLLLPSALWADLDRHSRAAVVMHELAHLRRRDHWWCWLVAAIGVVYWWHPVAWWTKRRLHEEAEASCDAWVTSLLPRGRRAYAEALVATRSFLSVPGRSGAPALSVMSGRTKQLARRITMVMTQRVAPRASILGLACAVGVAAAGMFVMPGLACPPEDGKDAKAVEKTRAQAAVKAEKAALQAAKAREKAERSAAIAREKAAERAGAAQNSGSPDVEFLGEAPALEAMLGGGKGGEAAKVRDIEAMTEALRQKERALRDMERRLQQMERELDRAGKAGGRGQSAPRAPRSDVTVGQPLATSPRPATGTRSSAGSLYSRGGIAATAPSDPIAPAPPTPPVAATAPVMPAQPAPPSPSGRMGIAGSLGGRTIAIAPSPFGTTAQGSAQGNTVARSYALPAGKLEALVALMSRQDVPILIEGKNDCIIVHATPGQHEVFAAFVAMINPGSGGSGPSSSIPSAGLTSLSAQQVHELQAHALNLAQQSQGLANSAQVYRAQAEALRADANRQREIALEAAAQARDEAEDEADDADDENSDLEGQTMDGDESFQAAVQTSIELFETTLDAQLERLDCLVAMIDEKLESMQLQFADFEAPVIVEPIVVDATVPVPAAAPATEAPAAAVKP